MPSVFLLGPQRFDPNVASAVRALGVEGRLAVVTAGWQEREGEHEELQEHIGTPLVDLALYHRTERIFREDPELFEALRERQDRLRQLQQLHRLRLAHALDAARELLHRDEDPALLEPERTGAIEAVRTLDRHHLRRVSDTIAEFDHRWRPTRRPAVLRQRRRVQALLRTCEALLIAGGHVVVLLNRLRLFGLNRALKRFPVIAWSAGAMVLASRVVLFHDSPPQGAGNAEVIEEGFGLCRGLLPLPHASTRLRLDDPVRVSLLARRFAPLACVAFDKGARVRYEEGRLLGEPGTLRLTPAGSLSDMGAAA